MLRRALLAGVDLSRQLHSPPEKYVEKTKAEEGSDGP